MPKARDGVGQHEVRGLASRAVDRRHANRKIVNGARGHDRDGLFATGQKERRSRCWLFRMSSCTSGFAVRSLVCLPIQPSRSASISTDRIGRQQVDRVFHVERGDEGEAVVEFDSSFGIYRLDLAAPKYRCTATDYLFFIAGHDRSVSREAERSHPARRPRRRCCSRARRRNRFFTCSPPSFSSTRARSHATSRFPLRCRRRSSSRTTRTVTTPGSTPMLRRRAGSQQFTLRLRTPTHQYHYVRVPIPFPMPWTGWPQSVQLNVTEEMVDALAADPVDTLLCPKMWRTSAG